MNVYIEDTDHPEPVAKAVKQTLQIIDAEHTTSFEDADVVCVFSAEDALDVLKENSKVHVCIVVQLEADRAGPENLWQNAYPDRASVCYVIPEQDGDEALITLLAKLTDKLS
jgi:hypothetical protein